MFSLPSISLPSHQAFCLHIVRTFHRLPVEPLHESQRVPALQETPHQPVVQLSLLLLFPVQWLLLAASCSNLSLSVSSNARLCSLCMSFHQKKSCKTNPTLSSPSKPSLTTVLIIGVRSLISLISCCWSYHVCLTGPYMTTFAVALLTSVIISLYVLFITPPIPSLRFLRAR